MVKEKEKLAFLALWLLAVFLIFCATGCSPSISTDSPDTSIETGYSFVDWKECSQVVGAHPCNFTLLDQNNNPWSLYDHYGKVVVLDFSAMWCGICNKIAQKGEEFINDYGADNVVWVTILIDDAQGNPIDQEDLQHWASTYNLSTPVLAGSRNMIDYSSKYGYNIISWPTMIVISKEMVITYGSHGWNEATTRQAVEDNL